MAEAKGFSEQFGNKKPTICQLTNSSFFHLLRLNRDLMQKSMY